MYAKLAVTGYVSLAKRCCRLTRLTVNFPASMSTFRSFSTENRLYAIPEKSIGRTDELFSPSVLAVQEANLIAKVGQVQDPCVGQPLQYNGSIRSVNITQRNDITESRSSSSGTRFKVVVALDLFIPGHPGASVIVDQIKACVLADSFIAGLRVPASTDTDTSVAEEAVSVEVRIDSDAIASRSSTTNTTGASVLSNVKHIIAVSSCKGGVGKSSVAVQLANSLVEQKRGALRPLRVGLLDADVYGPSIPHLCQPLDTTVRRSKLPHLVETVANPAAHISLVDPLETANGLKLMSFGYVNPKAGAPGAGQANGAAVMRGPIVTKVITQLLLGTNWGDLDYLILDMPPGTGDIIITICQSAPLSGAVIVTTPHSLATIDVVKGIEMFNDMKVPTLGIVENMSHFVCDIGATYFPFGESEGKQGLVAAMRDVASRIAPHKIRGYVQLAGKIESDCPYIKVPILPPATPDRNQRLRKTFEPLASTVLTELLKLQVKAQIVPQVSFNESKGKVMVRYFTLSSAVEYAIPPLELRRRYPHTGLEHSPEDQVYVDPAVKPVHFDVKGNYGVAIQWNDGYYTDIFPFEVLRQIALELNQR